MWTQLLSWFARTWFGHWYGAELTAQHYGHYLSLLAKGQAGAKVAEHLFAPFLDLKNSWFNHIIVNIFFTHLVNTCSLKNVVALSSNDFMPHEFSRLLYFLKRKDHFNKKRELLSQANIILWPVCEEAHWYLWLIKKVSSQQYLIRCLDGYNQFEKHKKMGEKISQFLCALVGRKNITIRKGSYYIHPQNNGRDCGAVVCQLGEKLCHGGRLLVCSPGEEGMRILPCRNYTPYRLHVAKVLASLPKEIFASYESNQALAYLSLEHQGI